MKEEEGWFGGKNRGRYSRAVGIGFIFTHEATVSHRGVVWPFFIIPFGKKGVLSEDRDRLQTELSRIEDEKSKACCKSRKKAIRQ